MILRRVSFIAACRQALRRNRRCRGIAQGIFLMLISLGMSLPVMAEEYKLGAQDKLTIRVVEWQTVEGTFREWSALSGEYVVGAAGNISIPFIGEMEAAGKTTAEIAEGIGSTLQAKFGLSDKPEAAVELAEYRPFYVSGDVENPGQYPYAPGLTVIKAVSIAGGLRKSSGMRAERDFIDAKGTFDVLADERLRLLVKRARLQAEAEEASEIALPEELADEPKLEAALADEKAIMAARQGRLKRRLEALDSLEGLLEGEIKSLEQKAVTQRRQVDLAKKELKGIGSLAEEGLVVNTRILNTERTIADLEGTLLDLETEILRAKQDISKASQDAIDLQSAMDAEIAIERQQVEAKLTEANLKMQMEHGLMTEALSVAPVAALSADGAAEVEFALVRTVDGKATEIAAEEQTPVAPGDVIKIRIALPKGSKLAGQ